jgi:hypothetical protein
MSARRSTKRQLALDPLLQIGFPGPHSEWPGVVVVFGVWGNETTTAAGHFHL